MLFTIKKLTFNQTKQNPKKTSSVMLSINGNKQNNLANDRENAYA